MNRLVIYHTKEFNEYMKQYPGFDLIVSDTNIAYRPLPEVFLDQIKQITVYEYTTKGETFDFLEYVQERGYPFLFATIRDDIYTTLSREELVFLKLGYTGYQS